ncbi:glycosyl transferase [Sorangium cellulosum]|uniref:Glycosyl transferase n=1 Tax=Sorangium cellulosum TaxID=56 RepID=A0A2L0EUE3_SORCE|nr:glycosyltransferase family 4 protein [Sorangium cellulosum]AUX42911.1 glycosyl transferase [Sorangium cellulosum]
MSKPGEDLDGGGRSRPLRVLWVTRIFPNRVEPLACAFQRQQLAALSRWCEVEVLATIPYHPGVSLLGARTRPGRLAAVPERDEIDGVPVVHPRAPYLPGAGRVLAPVNAPLYLAGLLPLVPQLRGRFDVVLGAWLYPDACAAAVLARVLRLPYAVKAHGTDVNVVARWRSVRPLVGGALRSAACAIGVSRPMVEALAALGAPRERVVLVRNGVDRALFRPGDRLAARRELGLPERGRIVTFVGNVVRPKGIGELLEAFEALGAPGGEVAGPVHLVVVGEGPERRAVEQAAARRDRERARDRERGGRDLGEERGRILAVGSRPLSEVARYLAATDLLVLPSWAEGTPNVVLEALAAARPVVATRVGGIPEVVEPGRTGVLVPPRDAAALGRALREALARTWDERAFAEAAPPSWEESAEALWRVLARAAFGGSGRAAA